MQRTVGGLYPRRGCAARTAGLRRGRLSSTLFILTLVVVAALLSLFSVREAHAAGYPPVARGDAYTVTEDAVLTRAAPGVLGNDRDPEGKRLIAKLTRNAAYGTATLRADGSFTYDSRSNFAGDDYFQYKACEYAAQTVCSTPVWVKATVSPVDDKPVGYADSYAAKEDTPLTVYVADGVLKNDWDAERDYLVAKVIQAPKSGTLSASTGGGFTYTPNADYSGTDTFYYQACEYKNQSLCSATTAAKIDVAAVNDAPKPQADSFVAREDTTFTAPAASGLLLNDKDPEGDRLTVDGLASGPAHGTATVNPDGSFTYKPNANFKGADTFTYRVTDGTATATAVATMNVANTNDPPRGVGDAFRTNEDTPLSVPAASGVLRNDSDPDGDTLSARIYTNPRHGKLTLYSNGAYTYAPYANYSGTDYFYYRACDTSGVCTGPIPASVGVNPVNDGPVAATDTFYVKQNVRTLIPAPGVLANDRDIDGPGRYLSKVSNAAKAGVSLYSTNGSIAITPVTGFVGWTQASYQMHDGRGGYATGYIRIYVGA